MSTYDLHGKIAIVTGGSRGLGLLIARELAERGARVVLTGRDATTLASAQRWLEERGLTALALPCDVTSSEDVATLVSDVVRIHGGVDVLINDAGIIEVGPRRAMFERDYQRAMATRLRMPSPSSFG